MVMQILNMKRSDMDSANPYSKIVFIYVLSAISVSLCIAILFYLLVTFMNNLLGQTMQHQLMKNTEEYEFRFHYNDSKLLKLTYK